MKKTAAGFTLIELIIVVGIIGLLMLVAVPTFNAMRDNVALKNSSQQIVSTLRLAQNRAITSQGGVQHSVQFTTNSFIIFGGTAGSPTYSTTYPLTGGIQILSGGTTVTFARLTGTTAATTIQVGFSSTKKQDIKIDATGNITIL